MVNYRPYEQSQLEALLSSGLAKADPSTAFQIFSGLQSGAVQRQAERQAMNQQMMQDAISNLQSYATTPGVDPAGLDALVGSYQAMNPALAKPKFDQGLDAAVGSLQPLVGGGGGGTGNLDQSAVDSIQSYATTAAQTGTTTLHDARMGYMATLRAMGVPAEQQAAAFDLYGKLFQAAAVNPDQVDVPVTAGAAAGEAGAAAPEMTSPTAQPGGGDPSILEQLIGGGPGMVMSSLTGGMSSGPQLLAGLPKIADDVGRLGGGIMGGAASLLGAGGGGAPNPPPRGPSQGKLEDLLRMLTGSLGGAASNFG
jgi:hypothetical protein